VNSQKKAELRRDARDRRKSLAPSALNSSRIHILQSPEFTNATHVASYISYGTEPRTDDLNEELMNRGIRVLVPHLLPDKDLNWIDLESNQRFDDFAKVTVVIIPSLGVDRNGFRLGQGGGSYDRALPRFKAWKIALIHDGEFVEHLPRDEWDAKIDAIADSQVILRLNR
jgi:5-formyltetrahydrofolate cyclo-ligase